MEQQHNLAAQSWNEWPTYFPLPPLIPNPYDYDEVEVIRAEWRESVRLKPGADPYMNVCGCSWRPIPGIARKLVKHDADKIEQMRAALTEIREKAATMSNGGAWAAGLAMLCLGTLEK